MSATTCKVCFNDESNQLFYPREMMFGSREKFPYLLCVTCGCLQLIDIPHDMSRHYPVNYYSFDSALIPSIPAWRRWLTQKRYKQELYGDSIIGSLINQFRGRPSVPLWLKKTNLRPSSKILDVGCGSGNLLRELHTMGFQHLLGADPFIQSPIHDKQIQVVRKQLDELEGPFDVIMFHHVFEHLPNPLQILQQASVLLADKGYLIIRIPIMGKYAWRTYGTDWVAIDAPRHFFLHTEKSMQVLCETANLEIVRLIYDSTAFQFWGSEQLRQDIPIRDVRSYATTRDDSLFPAQQMQEYRNAANRLNRECDGDQGCFILRKK